MRSGVAVAALLALALPPAAAWAQDDEDESGDDVGSGWKAKPKTPDADVDVEGDEKTPKQAEDDETIRDLADEDRRDARRDSEEEEAARREALRRRRKLIKRSMSLTFSPPHLIKPFLEIAGEFRAGPFVSVTAIVGAGKQTITLPDESEEKVTGYEAGAQVAYYFIGTFERGATASLELMYSGAQTDNVRGEALGVLVSPLLGFKLASGRGITINVQGGIQYLVSQAAGAEEQTDRLESSVVCDKCQLNVNFHLGYSF